MKNLENYGVQEMNAMEIRNTDGGTLPYTPNPIGTIVALAILNEVNDFMNGWNFYYSL